MILVHVITAAMVSASALAGPDLSVSGLTWSPPVPVDGGSVLLSAVVTNSGTPTSTQSLLTVTFRAGTEERVKTYSGSLAQGQSVTITADTPIVVLEGIMEVSARVVESNPFTEIQVNNNSGAGQMTVIPQGVKAIASDLMIDSMGVNFHPTWNTTTWGTRVDEWVPMMGELGIRYVRGGMNNPLGKTTMHRLFNEYGIKGMSTSNLLKPDSTPDIAAIPAYLQFIKDQVGVDKIIGFEPLNEYNQYRSTIPDWHVKARAFQTELYTKVKADPALAHLPVLGPSIWKRVHVAYEELGDISNIADACTLHNYSGGRKPTQFGDEGVLGYMDTAIGYCRSNVPGKPVWVTETGFNNFADTVDSPWRTPERTQAKYELRNHVEFFLRKPVVQKVFTYIFMDIPTKPDHAFGLVRDDLSRKPAYYAVKNFIKILGEKGSSFDPGYLKYSLIGDKTDVRELVLQKSDGKFYLLLWLDGESYIRTSGVEVDLSRRLTLDVGLKFQTLKVYLPTGLDRADPNKATNPTRVVDNPTTVSLNVPDQVMIVELTPKAMTLAKAKGKRNAIR